MEPHAIWNGLIGGAIIGVAAGLLLLLNGRIAGISGIYGGALRPVHGDFLWRVLFVAGLLAGGVILRVAYPEALPFGYQPIGGKQWGIVVAAGLLVGFGSRLGSGCTSGHGVCGVSRLSVRSLVATPTFMITGAIAVIIANLILGG